jgi:hypothetical protein
MHDFLSILLGAVFTVCAVSFLSTIPMDWIWLLAIAAVIAYLVYLQWELKLNFKELIIVASCLVPLSLVGWF